MEAPDGIDVKVGVVNTSRGRRKPRVRLDENQILQKQAEYPVRFSLDGPQPLK